MDTRTKDQVETAEIWETFLVTNVDEVMANLEAVYSAREQAYGEKPNVSQTLIGVAALLLPELKIEIKCIAQL